MYFGFNKALGIVPCGLLSLRWPMFGFSLDMSEFPSSVSSPPVTSSSADASVNAAAAPENASTDSRGHSYILRFRERMVAQEGFVYTPWTWANLNIGFTSKDDIQTMHALLFHFPTYLTDICGKVAENIVFYASDAPELNGMAPDKSTILTVSFQWLDANNVIIEEKNAVCVYKDNMQTMFSFFLGYGLLNTDIVTEMRSEHRSAAVDNIGHPILIKTGPYKKGNRPYKKGNRP